MKQNCLSEKDLKSVLNACKQWAEKSIVLAIEITIDGEQCAVIVTPATLAKLAIRDDSAQLFRPRADGVHIRECEIHTKGSCRALIMRALYNNAEKIVKLKEFDSWAQFEKVVASAYHAKRTGNEPNHIADILYHKQYIECKRREGLLWEPWME